MTDSLKMHTKHRIDRWSRRLLLRFPLLICALLAVVGVVSIAVPPPLRQVTIQPSQEATLFPTRPYGFLAFGEINSMTGNGQLVLSWSDSGDSSIIGYQYKLRQPDFQKEYGPWIDIPGSGATTTDYTISDLIVDRYYNVRLRAGNAAGWSDEAVIYRVRASRTLQGFTSDFGHHSPGTWFLDDDDNMHEGAIEALAAAGVTRGCRENYYCPAEEVTRGQFASLLVRAFPDLVPDNAEDFFDDDTASAHQGTINRLASVEMAVGCEPRRFCPDESLTRAQMTTPLARALPGLAPATRDHFQDDDAHAHEAAINVLAQNGVVSGCGPGRFCPDDPVRRDQMATLLTQVLGIETSQPPPTPWRLELVVGGITNLGDGPTDLQAPTGDDRLFLTTRDGTIRIIADGNLLPEPFLDLTRKVLSRESIEQGLLGLAFHPDYAANHKFYVFYTDLNGRNQVYEYQTDSGDPNRANPSTARHIITLDQGSGWHNGGQLQFGADGYLYISVGDGEDQRASQNPHTKLGTIVRIDIDNGEPYSIPSDNPFADGRRGLPEVWAYGLRNAWRFSFDGPHIYIADVGGGLREEVNVADASQGGINYGWPIMEGDNCSTPSRCDTAGLFIPQVSYARTQGIAVIGGYVYRGAAIPEMTGRYFYSDYTRWIRTFVYNGEITQHYDWTRAINRPDTPVYSFGVDGHGELYLLTFRDVYKIVPR